MALDGARQREDDRRGCPARRSGGPPRPRGAGFSAASAAHQVAEERRGARRRASGSRARGRRLVPDQRRERGDEAGRDRQVGPRARPRGRGRRSGRGSRRRARPARPTAGRSRRGRARPRRRAPRGTRPRAGVFPIPASPSSRTVPPSPARACCQASPQQRELRSPGRRAPSPGGPATRGRRAPPSGAPRSPLRPTRSSAPPRCEDLAERRRRREALRRAPSRAASRPPPRGTARAPGSRSSTRGRHELEVRAASPAAASSRRNGFSPVASS